MRTVVSKSPELHALPVGKPLMGAHAMGMGAVLAGCDYFSGYPITPQTELLEYLSQTLPAAGGTFQQLADEISSIMACYGAAAAGRRTMTASVGPGLTLMIDGITNAVGAELPMVIGAITRAHVGVSAGLLPAQSDMRMLKGLGNGDLHVPIYAPASVTETVLLTAQAFDVADRYRTPVFVAIDGFMSNMIETLLPVDIQPCTLPTKDWSVATSFAERRRHVTSYLSPEMDTYRTYKLQEKYARIEAHEVRYEGFMLDDAEFVVVAYGIIARSAKAAVLAARKAGIAVGLFRPITIYPFPTKALRALASTERVQAILMAEMNFGQVLTDVRLSVLGEARVEFLGQPAMPIAPNTIMKAIQTLSQGGAPEPIGFNDVHPGFEDEAHRLDAFL